MNLDKDELNSLMSFDGFLRKYVTFYTKIDVCGNVDIFSGRLLVFKDEWEIETWDP
jgi:hypothetical protein